MMKESERKTLAFCESNPMWIGYNWKDNTQARDGQFDFYGTAPGKPDIHVESKVFRKDRLRKSQVDGVPRCDPRLGSKHYILLWKDELSYLLTFKEAMLVCPPTGFRVRRATPEPESLVLAMKAALAAGAYVNSWEGPGGPAPALYIIMTRDLYENGGCAALELLYSMCPGRKKESQKFNGTRGSRSVSISIRSPQFAILNNDDILSRIDSVQLSRYTKSLRSVVNETLLCGVAVR